MNKAERDGRQDRLNKLLYTISLLDTGILNQNQITEKAKELIEIYKNGFRHQYSALFPVIQTVLEGNKYDLETLLENLRKILGYIERTHESSREFDGLFKPLVKLIDHINLEVSRFNVEKSYERNLEYVKKDLLESQNKLGEAEGKLKNAERALETVNVKVENSMTQVVSVLSIFAAIVIAFSGGINFLGNAIASIQNVIIFKSVLICLVCGLVLFNIVFLMLYIVGKIIEKDIFARCPDEDTAVGPSGTMCRCNKNCNGISKIKKRLPYVYWVNFIGLILCGADVCAWWVRISNIWSFPM